MKAMSDMECFSANGRKIDITVSDFWNWAYSDLSDYSCRSALAEYIVASALQLTNTKMRQSGFMKKPYDLLTREGYRVSVRSAAYIESLDAKCPDCVSFHISYAGMPRGNREIHQAADICVFCVYKGMKEGDSPLNLNLWEFCVLTTKELDKKRPGQKTITLPSLMKLKPLWCDYYRIEEAISVALSA